MLPTFRGVRNPYWTDLCQEGTHTRMGRTPSMESWFIMLILHIAGSIQQAHAARRVDVHHHLMRRSVAPSADKTREQLFGLSNGEQLQRGATYRTARGTLRVKMTETYQGLPIIGEAVVLEVDEGEEVIDVYGRLVEGLQEDLPSVVPMLSIDDAFNIALTAMGDEAGSVQFNQKRDASRAVYVQGTPEKIQPSLIYLLSYRVENYHRVARPSFYIEANTGSILRHWDGLSGINQKKWISIADLLALPDYVLIDAEGGNVKVGKKHYNGKELPQLRVTRISNTTCSLRNTNAIVYHCRNSYTCPQDGDRAHEFVCDSGNPDETNGAYSPLNDALFHVGVAFQMYREWYGITNPLQGSPGGRCKVRGHFGQRLETAFWNGEYVTVGDGDRVHYPLSSLNVIAHEMSHGFTESHSGLVYEGESGAINEAFSDMAGEAAEEFLKHSVDWAVAADSMKGVNDAMRYFADPSLDGRSVSRVSEYCFTMDPHISSGIFNKVFYTLSNTQGWNVRKAFHVFVLANDIYWHPDSDFNSAACDVLQAASDLEYNREDIQKAFEGVGVAPCNKPEGTHLLYPIIMSAGGTVTYDLTSNVRTSLRYSDLVIYVYGSIPMEVVVIGASNRFQASKEKSVYDMIEANAVAIHTFHQCLHRPCTVTISTQDAGKVVLNPLAYINTLISGESLHRTKTALEVEFEIPQYVLNTRLRVAFTAEKVGGDLSYYIQHGQAPVVEVGSFDVVGHSSLPAVLCTPRAGRYFLKVVSDETRVTNINIHMYTLLGATRRMPAQNRGSSSNNILD